MTALELLRRLVELESPTSDSERLSHIGLFIAAELESLGGRVEFRGRPLLARMGNGRAPAAPPAPLDTGLPHGRRAGVSAIEELAHQVTAVHAFADEGAGVRTNVGQVGGGTGDNVVAADAWARIDARAWTAEAQARLEAAIYGLEPKVDGSVIE